MKGISGPGFRKRRNPTLTLTTNFLIRQFKRDLAGDGGAEFFPYNRHRRGDRHNHSVVATGHGWRKLGTDPLGRNSPRLSRTWTLQADDVGGDDSVSDSPTNAVFLILQPDEFRQSNAISILDSPQTFRVRIAKRLGWKSHPF